MAITRTTSSSARHSDQRERRPSGAAAASKPSTGSERIGTTAHYTAYVWYRLGLPYAELFKTPRGAVLYWALEASGGWLADLAGVPTVPEWLSLRHRLIEAAVVAESPDVVIEVASGLSRRGTTLAADHGVRYFELDLPHMIRAKRTRLAEAPGAVRERIEERLTLQEVDALADDFPDRVAAIAKDADRPVVITEGLLPYFGTPQKIRIMGGIREGLEKAGGGVYVTDMRTEARMAAVGVTSYAIRAGAMVAMRGKRQATELRDDAEVRDVFERAGFLGADMVDTALIPNPPRRPQMGAIWRAAVSR